MVGVYIEMGVIHDCLHMKVPALTETSVLRVFESVEGDLAKSSMGMKTK